MSLKDAFSGLKEELGKDLQSEVEKASMNSADGNSNSTRVEKELLKTGTIDVQEEEKHGDSANETSSKTGTSRQGKRKVGKRSDPDFTQAPAFIRKITHQQVKINLITDPDFNDYSELVEALLVQWLEQKKKGD